MLHVHGLLAGPDSVVVRGPLVSCGFDGGCMSKAGKICQVLPKESVPVRLRGQPSPERGYGATVCSRDRAQRSRDRPADQVSCAAHHRHSFWPSHTLQFRKQASIEGSRLLSVREWPGKVAASSWREGKTSYRGTWSKGKRGRKQSIKSCSALNYPASNTIRAARPP